MGVGVMSDMKGRGLTTPLKFDLQETYDQARALSSAWDAFAFVLATEGGVCQHPEGSRNVIAVASNVIHTCTECDRIVMTVPLEESD